MVALLRVGVNMQVKIELVNDFYGLGSSHVRSRTSRSLTPDQANAVYGFIEKLMGKLEEKSSEYWKNKQHVPQQTFKLTLEELVSTTTNGLSEETWDDLWEEDWILD